MPETEPPVDHGESFRTVVLRPLHDQIRPRLRKQKGLKSGFRYIVVHADSGNGIENLKILYFELFFSQKSVLLFLQEQYVTQRVTTASAMAAAIAKK